MAFVKVFPYLRKSTAVRNDFGWEQQKSQRRGVDKEKTSFLTKMWRREITRCWIRS